MHAKIEDIHPSLWRASQLGRAHGKVGAQFCCASDDLGRPRARMEKVFKNQNVMAIFLGQILFASGIFQAKFVCNENL